MIPEQLSLFGAVPRPPKKVVEDELPAATDPATEATVMTAPEIADHSEAEPATNGHALEVESPENSLMESIEAIEDDVSEEIIEKPETWAPVSFVETNRSPEPPNRGAKASSEDGPNIPDDEVLFSKQYYTMRETAAMFGISHSMLRFWEAEFDSVKPKKNKKGDRYFRPADIKQLALIYHLLKVRKFTTSGARDYLRNHNKALDSFELVQKLEKLKLFLQELKTSL